MLIDVQLLAAIHVILPPAPSVFQESSDAGVYTRGSVRRASGFVLTGKQEVMNLGQRMLHTLSNPTTRSSRSSLADYTLLAGRVGL